MIKLSYIYAKPIGQRCEIYVTFTSLLLDRRLFWADVDLEQIESSDLAGQGRKVILTARGQLIHGISVDEDWVYFTSYATK